MCRDGSKSSRRVQRCYPPHATQTHLLETLDSYATMNGIDRAIGLRATLIKASKFGIQ